MATPVPFRLLKSDDVLPLTCTRQGTCCHGKAVWVNPWEVASLAHTLGTGVQDVMQTYTCDGGIRLRFDGPPGFHGLAACSLYQSGLGCRVHPGRPLACRLYPLGRRRSGTQVDYLHEGSEFPCLEGCPEVTTLSPLTVGAYLTGQDVSTPEQVSDAYLEVVQDLAEGAFVVVIDSGLVASGFRGVLARWRWTTQASHQARSEALAPELLGMLLDPGLDPQSADFVQEHADRLRQRCQQAFAHLRDPGELTHASCAMLGLALHLAASLGADVGSLSQRWLQRAREHGVR